MKNLREGDLVKSKSRPELEIGTILRIQTRDTSWIVRWPHMEPVSYSFDQLDYRGREFTEPEQIRLHVRRDLIPVSPLEALAAQAEFITCSAFRSS